MKILLAISTLGPGGAERVVTLLANGFVAREHEVTILTLEAQQRDFYPVDAAVRRVELNLSAASASWLAGLAANLKRVRAIRRAVRQEQPDVVVAFITEMNVLATVACLGLPVRVFISERIDPRQHPVGRAWDWLRRTVYRYSQGLIVQTRTVAQWLAQSGIPLPPVTVIANPVLAAVPRALDSPSSAGYLLAVGRLVEQKGFDLAIAALASLAQSGVELELVIAGEGPCEAALRQQAEQLQLGGRVRLIGRAHDIGALLAGAFAFVLPSRYEGFPNVLLEALAAGVPTIAADCESGPREILADGTYGILVPCKDSEALAAAVLRLRRDSGLQAELRRAGPEAVKRFSVEAITDAWERVLMARAAD
jgi:glycosyltransferase involved in cell wall biosynthesis